MAKTYKRSNIASGELVTRATSRLVNCGIVFTVMMVMTLCGVDGLFAQGRQLLGPNEALGVNEYLEADQGRFRLTNQGDGNVVLTVEGWPVWNTGTSGTPGPLTMQGDGNVVLSRASGAVSWSTHTSGHPNAIVVLQDDGNLVVYGGGIAVWDSHTSGAVQPPGWWGHDGVLYEGEERVSANGVYRLRNESGQLALYRDGYRLWASVAGSSGYAVMQADGNLVFYRNDGSLPWHTVTYDHPDAHVEVRFDGDIVVRDVDGTTLWHSNTANLATPSPTISINGGVEGAALQTRTGTPTVVQVDGARGSGAEFVWLLQGNDPKATNNLNSRHSLSWTIEPDALPEEGSVQAVLKDADRPDAYGMPTELARSALLQFLPVSLSVNGQPPGHAVDIFARDAFSVVVSTPAVSPGDWVGLFEPGASNASPLQKRFLNDSATTPPSQPLAEVTLHFTMPEPWGQFYELRLIDGITGAVVRRNRDAYSRAPRPTLTLNGRTSGLSVAPATAITVTFADAPVAAGLWFMVYPTNQCCIRSSSSPSVELAPPRASGQVNILAPASPGAYKVYLVNTDELPGTDWVGIDEAASAEFTVSTQGAQPPPVLTINGLTLNSQTVVVDLSLQPVSPLQVAVTGGPLTVNDTVELRPRGNTAGSTRFLNGGTTAPSAVPSPVSFAMAVPAAGLYDSILHRAGGVDVGGPLVNIVGSLSTTGADETFFFDTDAIGSVRQIVQWPAPPTGQSVWRQDYQPFGVSAQSDTGSPSPKANALGFGGKELDTTGLNYFGARYYSGITGRFTTVDPRLNVQKALADPQEWNRYVYVSNRPTRFTDPDGRAPILVGYDNYAFQWAREVRERVASVLGGGPGAGGGLVGSLGRSLVDEALGFVLPRDRQEATALSNSLILGIAAPIESPGAAASYTLKVALQKQLVSEAQLGEKGIEIAGGASGTVFRDAAKYAAQYGGQASDWVKKSSSAFKAADGQIIQTHWVENLKTGARVAAKTIWDSDQQ